MLENVEIDRHIALLLGKLATFCNRGFALAIHIRYTRPTLLYQTYAQDWSDHYSEKGYMLSDPVVGWGLTHSGWVEWASLTDQDPQGVIADAVAHGLTNGWTYSTGPAGSRTIAGLPRAGAPFSDAERAEMATLVDLAHDLTEGFDSFPADLKDRLRRLG